MESARPICEVNFEAPLRWETPELLIVSSADCEIAQNAVQVQEFSYRGVNVAYVCFQP